LRFDEKARKFFGTPDEMDVSYEIKVLASDGYKNTTDSFSFNLNNIPPILN
jgi:hypothetical protein